MRVMRVGGIVAAVWSVCLGVLAGQAASGPALEVVAEWNSLPYVVENEAMRARWRESEWYGKALLHGVKVDSRGTFYVSTARWKSPDIPATLSKLVREDGGWALKPFPSDEMNSVDTPDGLKSVLGFEIDRDDVMWILDQGHVAGSPSGPGDEKLVLWDLRENREIGRYVFSDADSDKNGSFLNDVAVDNDNGFAYISDSGVNSRPLSGGLIVYDRKANAARRVLDKSPYTVNEPHFFFNVDGIPVGRNRPMLTGADGIALSGDNSTLYWTNLTGNTLYALDTALLRDFSVPESRIEEAVRVVTSLPSNTDGITCDGDGNLYMTALALNGIMRRDAKTGEVTRFAYHKFMSWPDTLAWGPDGSLYVVSNHLNLYGPDEMDFEGPAVANFRIWRIPQVGQPYVKE